MLSIEGGRAERAAASVAWALLAGAAVFVLLLGGGYFAFASLDIRIAMQVGWLVLSAVWLMVAIRRPWWRPNSALFVPLLVVAAVLALSTLTSTRPRLSLTSTTGAIALIVGYLFMTRLFGRTWFRERAANLLVVLVAVVSVGYIGQVLLQWIEWWRLIGGIAFPPLRPGWAALTLGTPNLIAGFLVLVGPLATVLSVRRRRSARSAVAFACVIGLAVVLTGSRAAYLGVAAGGAAALVLAARSRGLRTPVSHVVRQNARLVVLGLVLALGGVLALVPAFLQRLEQGGDVIRYGLWRASLRIFADHPVLGGGPGTWPQLKVAANEPGVPNPIFSNAHNLYVQLAAELGILGILATVILATSVVWLLVRGSTSPRRPLRVETIAVSASLAAFGAQAVFDTLTNVPMASLLIASIVAWTEAGVARADGSIAPRDTSLGRGARQLRAQLAGVIAIAAGLACLAPTFARFDAAATSQIVGNEAAGKGDWPAARAAFEMASALDPDLTLYSLQLASALAHEGNAAEARKVLAEAVALDPVAINQIGLAALVAASGDLQGALRQAKLAASIGAGEFTVALNAGLIAESAGDLSYAREQFAAAIAWNPPLAALSIWTHPDRRIPKADVIDAAVARTDSYTGSLVLAYAGDTARAADILLRLPASHLRDTYLAVTLWRSGDSPGARRAIERILADDPLDWVAAAWLSRICRLDGDAACAARFAQWAEVVQADAAWGVIDELSALPPLPFDGSAGLPASYPTAVYQRPVSPYLAMPQLLLVGAR